MPEPLLSADPGRQDYNTNGTPSPTTSRMAALLRRAYPGQDNRTTSKRELLAWYGYCFASEVYAVVSLTTYIPVTLEQLASEKGVLYSDFTTPCRPPDPSDPALLRRFVDGDRCVFKLFGTWWIDTASFALYVFSMSVLLQALVVISMSGAADHGSHRKNLLITFAMVGSVACMLFAAVGKGGATWAGLLAIIGNVAFGASIVCLNAFLPLLVRNHPSLQNEPEEVPPQESGVYSALPQDDAAQPLTEITPSETRQSLLLSTRISTQGIAVGYSSGVFLQLTTIPLVILTGSTTKSLQLAVLVSGVWWALFSIPAAIWMRPRPGPPLPASKSNNPVRRVLGYIIYGWKVIFATLAQARRLKDVMLFLAAWFLLSDGYTTITSTAILFAKTTLGIGPAGLALIGILATTAGILGAILWPRVLTPRLKFLHNSPHKTILLILSLSLFIPLYGLLGFLPIFQRIGFGGLVNKYEIYGLAFIFGFLYGGIQGYCRSFFAELVPRGLEANMFALYAVTDKGSSAVGPAVVGLITDLTHEIRWAFLFLGLMIGASIPLMRGIDVVRGKADAEAWSAERQVHEEEEEGREG